MSEFLIDDADLIYHFIGGRNFGFDAGSGSDPMLCPEDLRERILALPPERFSEAVKFLRRLNMVLLLPNGTCGCGSTRFDIVATDAG